MGDQAGTLKEIADREAQQARPRGKRPRVVAVTSGKGGVGKTNIAVNLSICMARGGKRVLLLDADLGLGNVDVLLGLNPRYNISDLVSGEKSLDDVLVNGPSGIRIMPAGSGIVSLGELTGQQKDTVMSKLSLIERDTDLVIVDTGAGISNNVMYFNEAADEIILVTSPEPTAVTDAYAMIKIMSAWDRPAPIRLLVNSVRSNTEALEIYDNLRKVAKKFLGVPLDYSGCVFLDDSVTRSVQRQRAFMEEFPNSRASGCIKQLALSVAYWDSGTLENDGVRNFWGKLINFKDEVCAA